MVTTPFGTSGSLRARKKQQTHERICAAASALFMSQGFANTTVDAIAERADISKPTLFNYFPSKLAVLHALIDRMDAQFVRYIHDTLDAPATTKARLQTLMARSAKYIHRAPELTRLVLVEGLGAIGDLDKARARFALLHCAMAELVAAGQQQGDVRRDYATELLVQLLVGGYLYALLNWLSSSGDNLSQNLEDTARLLAESLAPHRSD